MLFIFINLFIYRGVGGYTYHGAHVERTTPRSQSSSYDMGVAEIRPRCWQYASLPVGPCGQPLGTVLCMSAAQCLVQSRRTAKAWASESDPGSEWEWGVTWDTQRAQKPPLYPGLLPLNLSLPFTNMGSAWICKHREQRACVPPSIAPYLRTVPPAEGLCKVTSKVGRACPARALASAGHAHPRRQSG